jgi:hypothetical protein
MEPLTQTPDILFCPVVQLQNNMEYGLVLPAIKIAA